ncbi:MAG: UDP-N-acetylmuramoyl-tripeptide--D-alanyl-D-alanine ligase [Leptospiraceae bacterium]|nr:UDP-N-acetylmuramoyl-tripeptide--D-alanyl-D-alanine ligase [Leptospiraceae bacterium]MCP5497353.1 UDP-N-acetylmuramoyl-tripeptide--D-alanyl-D-alanine ligase [Leptospiraceae bacterium]
MIEQFHYRIDLLRKLLKSNTLPNWGNSDCTDFITTSSMEVQSNSLFVPLVGNRDGHDFIQDALNKDAIAFLCQKNHPILKKLTPDQLAKAIVVDDTLSALGKLAWFHRSRFIPFTIAITGSSGKTTAKEILTSAFGFLDSEEVVATEKNYNNEIGLPFTLFRVNQKTKILICEMGMNHLGEISRLSSIAKPDVSLITNIGPAHIEHLKSLKNIAKAKAEILDGMSGGSSLFFPDSILFKKLLIKKCKKQKVKFFPYKIGDDLKILNTHPHGYELQISDEKIDWRIPGSKILETLSGVVSILRHLSVSFSGIVQRFENFQSKNGRLVVQKLFYQLIDDTYNANPDSMVSSLDVANQIGKGSFYAILGDMKELGKHSTKYHKEIGKYCASLKLKGLITYGSYSECIGKTYLKSFKSGFHKHFLQKDEEHISLVEMAKKQIPQNSTILIKGSRSMKMEGIVKLLEELKQDESNG